jgi:hypothetical protein
MSLRRVMLATVIAVPLATTSARAAEPDIGRLAGVYKTTFKNGNIAGDKYQSENILEIVKVSPTAAYIRTHLEFFNGHVCDIWGVAKAEGGALVNRGEINTQGKPCVLSVKASGGKVVLEDKEGACAINTCGARGMYNGTSFDLKRRRTIRYMKILLKSGQYLDAIDESEGKPKTRLP